MSDDEDSHVGHRAQSWGTGPRVESPDLVEEPSSPPKQKIDKHMSFRRKQSIMVESRIRRLDRRPRRRSYSRRRYSDYDTSPDRESEDEGPVAVVYKVAAGGNSQIDVESKHLLKAIHDVNAHPPLRPSPDAFSEEEPFPTLFYHMDDIRAEINKLDDEEARLDLEALERVARDMAPVWKEAREEKFESGQVSYDLIWRLFHRGDLVVREDDLGNVWIMVLIDMTPQAEDVVRRRGGTETKRYIKFSCWTLAWDGVEKQLGRRTLTFECASFNGRKPITSLPVYPLRYVEKKKGGEDFRKTAAERGKQWWKYIGARTTCLQYSGLAYIFEVEDYRRRRVVVETRAGETPKRSRVDSRVVIDDEAKGMGSIDTVLGTMDDERYDDVRGPAPEVADYREAYQWDKLPVETKLTDEQAMLCPPIIGCYGVRTKEFYSISVDKLEVVKWNIAAMDHVVLDDKKKDMLKGLVGYHYSRVDENTRGDLIAGKGQSLVILLHGPPGVGKTLTAESVAEAVGKPLIALSIGDMVWDESRLQERLESEFKRATDWDAILLLDEADVVLEARSFEDVRRNGIVSVFLRQLEYYQGILFLTTNRVSTMDTAFQSRIQIGIAFQSMTPDIRAQVWGQLLALNGRDKIIGSKALEDVRQKLSKRELNGRQIRNVLNVAEGLAFNQYGEAGKLKYSHIQEAVEAAMEFQGLLEDAKSAMKTDQTVWAPYRGGGNDLSYM